MKGDQEVNKGIKTFLLNVDASLDFDDEQLQSLFLSGFEVYPLAESRLIPLTDQVECLIGLFEELILFFNIDRAPPSGTWKALIQPLVQKYEEVRFGVIHHERDESKRRELEATFVFDVGVQAGCIYLENQAKPDLNKLNQILVANEANGRRKAIRSAVAGRLNILLGGRRFEGKVEDVSISHFICSFKRADPEVPESTRMNDIQMIVGGTVFNVDAAVLIKRRAGGEVHQLVYVCGFMKKGQNQLGLGPQQSEILIRIIHRSCTDKIHDLVQTAFQNRRKLKITSQPSTPGEWASILRDRLP